MDLDELTLRLVPFCRAHLNDPRAEVRQVEHAPGHAGFAYLFDVATGGHLRRYFLRLPPPDVKLEGTADVLRQVCALKALDGTDVPHAAVTWSGDDPRWFGRPYFIVPRLEGDVFRGEWLSRFSEVQCWSVAEQTMRAIAGVHRVDWRTKAVYLGEFWGFEFDISRWDRFYERAAEPQYLALQPRVRQALLDRIPQDTRIGLYHGDFQMGNVMVSTDARVQAIIDWELTGIGATLNDVGWMSAFNEPQAWDHPDATPPDGSIPRAAELQAMYTEAWGEHPGDIAWFMALALYKFAIISGFNLMLHRRGKRDDPHWEVIAPSMRANMEFALGLLGG
jgi:aminoglycoside phosphotransferase (APT) family kinase protein